MPNDSKKEGGTNGMRKKERERKERKRGVQRQGKKKEREWSLLPLLLLTHGKNAHQGTGPSSSNQQQEEESRESSLVCVSFPPLIFCSPLSLSREIFSSSSSFFSSFSLFLLLFFQKNEKSCLSGRWRGSPPWPWRVSVFICFEFQRFRRES